MNTENNEFDKHLNENLIEWQKADFIHRAFKGYDLGKYLFTVSTGTMGLVVTYAGLTGVKQLNWNLGISMALFFISMSIALSMLTPSAWEANDETDLRLEYARVIRANRQEYFCWIATWATALLIAVDALVFVTPYINKLLFFVTIKSG